ncbi:hypothetical protein FRX31_015637 [Thalictrum thalictroides]|uniref:Reverse transcriptase zinc-binding domain-containing protein n=1 Tax=Thalictrum thalictroides TaxID=46969 RepID=A0A7J6WCR4_THATH|nr:hypothetical protein FRX31_015637 [Thalictrum thalictroides]
MGHLFLHCDFVGRIWERILAPLITQTLSLHNFLTVEAFLLAWPRPAGNEFGVRVWKLAPYAVLWSIWRARNDNIFRGRVRNAMQVQKEAMAYLWNWMANDEHRKEHHFRELLLEWGGFLHQH